VKDKDPYFHVHLGDDAKYPVKGEGKIAFNLNSRGLLYSQDVLYVPCLKNSFLSVSVMEDMVFDVTFERGKVLIHPKKSILNNAVVVGVREGNLYRWQDWYTIVKTHVIYGTGGWDSYTTGIC
jgi:hypothetical protein